MFLSFAVEERERKGEVIWQILLVYHMDTDDRFEGGRGLSGVGFRRFAIGETVVWMLI
jgi:hypothetical protein